MQLTQLERIVLVAETGNITEAARKLYISQPSLSQMITLVENEIGAEIFDRRTWPLKLTSEGECFIRTAKQILSAKEAMLEDIHHIKAGLRGKITIGTSIPRCRNILRPILPKMLEAYPNVTLSFVEGKSHEFEEMILFGSVDLALSNLPPNSEQIGCRALNEEHYYLVANRESALARRLDAIRSEAGRWDMPFSLHEAAGENFILLHPERNSRIVFNQIIREINFSPHIAIEVYNTDIALEYVEANLGIAILASTSSNIQPFPYQTDTLSFFVIDSKYAVRDLYLYYDSYRVPNPAQQYIIDLLLESFAKKTP